MRILIYLLEDKELAALVTASTGKALAPVLLRGITLENLADEVLPVVTKMREPRAHASSNSR